MKALGFSRESLLVSSRRIPDVSEKAIKRPIPWLSGFVGGKPKAIPINIPTMNIKITGIEMFHRIMDSLKKKTIFISFNIPIWEENPGLKPQEQLKHGWPWHGSGLYDVESPGPEDWRQHCGWQVGNRIFEKPPGVGVKSAPGISSLIGNELALVICLSPSHHQLFIGATLW